MVCTPSGSQRHNLIPEIQLKRILSYLNAHIVETYVFVEERSFQGSEIVDDDVRSDTYACRERKSGLSLIKFALRTNLDV
ncbi:MAG: hypothetical protein EA428_03500 [Spirochaetaceae bacterium]|nr:MAG: hypothetical protein EA428_03500 [Spirochaetaceae bacterium]